MGNETLNVMLTGGAGFIGSHLAEALIVRGAELTIVDNLDDFYLPAWKKQNLVAIERRGRYEFCDADICDYARMEEAFATRPPDVLIHLAARAGVRPSIEQPCLYEKINVSGTVNLLELCRKFRVRKFIFGSSSSVYGATGQVPFSEDQVELRPISPYAATKLSGELLCYTYAHLFQISMICLRFFTVYGPRQRPDLAIHKFTSLMEAGLPLPVFGDGSSGRDYTYVDDIVSGVLSALEYESRDSSAAPFEVFNLGNSHPVKLTALIEKLEHATGRQAIRNPKPMPLGDVPITWANISKASRLLGYCPATALDEGLSRFVTWYRSTVSDRRVPSLGAPV
jgi:UDP-glucuronate 4-epimerase